MIETINPEAIRVFRHTLMCHVRHKTLQDWAVYFDLTMTFRTFQYVEQIVEVLGGRMADVVDDVDDAHVFVVVGRMGASLRSRYFTEAQYMDDRAFIRSYIKRGLDLKLTTE